MEKSKTERSPWVKSRKKPGPKKRKRKGFAEETKKSLAESDKGSWFGQALLSTSTDEHERSNSAGSVGSTPLHARVQVSYKEVTIIPKFCQP